MASISAERGSVNAKALFTAGLAKAQAEVVKRLGEEVGKGLDESIDQVLGRGAYVRRKHVGSWLKWRRCVTDARVGRASYFGGMGIVSERY